MYEYQIDHCLTKEVLLLRISTVTSLESEESECKKVLGI